ncbi:toprim domain-containing protein [Chryseobacterium sp. LC2016-29]|uniref:toprim domain-containing protein n=1 Tax=Chryseobacterium sp. LC2016-29 TaxID=2897331 RepID=UPI001E56BB37|nr:toprim domain-containing protein [Chryseobacterium sp. LC2016-29]MCD0477455.1 toprim domain-containing protein [Chryseobacterium sp. LC2016-29]
MNCFQAIKVPIRKVLESFSLFPSKENGKTAFYFALDREERTPSLSVNFIDNTAFDFGTGKKFDNVSLVQAVKKCSVSEALKYLEGFDYSFIKRQVFVDKNNKFEISALKNLEHPALIEYLNNRKINFHTDYLKEIHYQISGKKYFGIAFENNSGGFEVRNKYAKLCLGKKDITTLKKSERTLLIFEGFLDFISFKMLEHFFGNPAADYIILNSVTQICLLRNIEQSYKSVQLYLDNDNAGDKATLELQSIFPNAQDQRLLYSKFKDVNEFLMSDN